jgi:hypothetical protein
MCGTVTFMDLSAYRGCFLGSISTEAQAYENASVRIELTDGPYTVAVLEFRHVARMVMDECGSDWCGFFDDFHVLELPRVGPWPDEARGLLHHDNNESALLWVRMTGPVEIEILARDLVVERTGAPITVQVASRPSEPS